MNYKETFTQALRKTNTSLNLTEGFPLYDVLILPASDMLDEIDASLTAAEDKVDITRYFDDSGYIKSEEYYTILKNNYALPDQFSDKASVTVYLLADSPSDFLSINVPVSLTREGKTFIIPESDYTNITWQTRDEYFAFPVIAVAAETGTEYATVSPGYWEANVIVEGVDLYVTDVYPSGGEDITGTLTYDRVLTMLSNKGWDNVPALVQHLYDDILSEQPGKLSVVKLNDTELESGLIPVADAYLQTGNSADIRMHFGQETITEQVTGEYLSGWFQYTFPEHTAVYGITTVLDFLGGSVSYKMDYFQKTLYFATPTVIVTYVGTKQDQIEFVRSTIAGYAFNHMGSVYVIKSFYPVAVYVDASCFLDSTTVTAARIAEVNTLLGTYITPANTFESITFQELFTEVFTKTKYYMQKFKVRLGGRTGMADEATYISEFGASTSLSQAINNTVTFVKNNITYTLVNTNSLIIGGLV
jgi:hypothetical protein